MLRRFVASRTLVSLTAGVIAVVVTTAVAFVFLEPLKKTIAYCALMPDSIGLYDGNEVTMRGIHVGTVTGLRAEGTGVRVEFEVDAAHPLRGAAKATTVSETIVADRALAIFGSSGADWDAHTCITETVTPKSLTQAFDALSKVADELQGGDDPVQRDRVKHAVTLFDQATAGTGPQLNDIIMQLSQALRSPDAAIGHIGSLIDVISQLSTSVANGWGNLREMLNGFAPILQTVNDVWDQVVEVVNSIVTLLPWLNDVTTKYGAPLLDLLDQSVPYLHLIGANVGGVRQLIDMVPPLAALFRTSTDPRTGRVAVNYAPPKVEIDQAQAAQVCAALNVVTAGACEIAGEGLTKVSLVPLVLGIGGAR